MHLLLKYVMPQVTLSSSVLMKMVKCAVLQIFSAPGIFLMSKFFKKEIECVSSYLVPQVTHTSYRNNFMQNYGLYLKSMTLPIFIQEFLPSHLKAAFVLAW